MSTNPTPQPTAEGVQQQLEATQQALQQAQNAPQAPDKPEQKFVIETATGQRFIGKTQAEVIAEMQKSIEHSTQELKRLHDIEKEYRAVKPPEPQLSPEEQAALQARKWMADELAQYFGLPNGDELRARLEQTTKTTQEMEQMRTVQQFHAACEDFPATDAAAGHVLKIMQEEGLPFSVRGLTTAHKMALAQGLYQAVPQGGTNAAPPTPPPTFNGSGSGSVPGEPDYNAMPTAELRALIERGGK